MSRIRRKLARVVLAYRLICARQDAHHHGIRVPTGAWSCERCGVVVWELDAFVRHGRLHAA